MKKTWLAVIVVLTIGVIGYQVADAGPGWGGGMMAPGCGNCQNYYGGPAGQGLDEEAVAKRDKFLEGTAGLRKQLAVKGAELEAVMNQDNPDEKKVANLAGEVFDLRNQLRSKAKESGIQGGFGPRGCDGPCGGGGPGMGGGHGRRGCGPRSW